MLIFSKNTIRRTQLKFLILAIGLFSISFLGFIIPSSLPLSNYHDRSGRESTEFFTAVDLVANTIFPNIEFFKMVLIGVGLIALSIFSILWVPRLPLENLQGRTSWQRNRYGLPERINLLVINHAFIAISRRPSINGLLLREFEFEIYLPKDDSRIHHLSDFGAFTTHYQTGSHEVLAKTVKSLHIPTQIVQTRALLAITN